MTSRLIIAAAMLSTLAFAQELAQTTIVRHGVMAGGEGVGPQTFEYVANSVIQLDGAVVKNAPYSAEAVTETTQSLADGNRISRKTNATLYRDSEGRTRREEAFGAIGPWAPDGEPAQSVFINDPVSKTNLVLDTKNKTVRKMSSPDQGLAKAKAELEDKMKVVHIEAGAGGGVGGAVGWAAAAPIHVDAVEAKLRAEMDLKNSSQKESLGTQMIEGVQAEGTRTTLTIPAGAVGNDLPIKVVSERWYSPELHTVVMTKHSDPRMGDTVYRLTNINRNEPAPSLFQAPADFTPVSENKFFVKTKD